MSASHVQSFPQSAASCSPPSITLLIWMLTTEERLGRQALHIAQLEARHDITALLARFCFAMSTSCPRSGGQCARSQAYSQRERVDTASSDHSDKDCSTAAKRSRRATFCTESLSPTALSLSNLPASGQMRAGAQQRGNDTHRSTSELPLSWFWPQLADLHERLTEVERAMVPWEGSQQTANASPPPQHRFNSSRPTMDECIALLDSLVTSQEESESRLPLQFHSRKQHVLSILAELRDALRSIQASYRAATGIHARVSLETLLQLPPETLPLLMCTDDGMRYVRQHHGRCLCDVSGEIPVSGGLLSSTSIYTLWTALMDGVDILPCFSRTVAEALWSAVLWMHACATLPPPVHGKTPALAPAGRRNNTPGMDAAPHDQTFLAPISSGMGRECSPIRPLRVALQKEHRTDSASLLQYQPVRNEAEPQQLCAPWETREKLVARRQDVIAPALKNPLREEEERWAYRNSPIRSGFTAPTVYDDLFPLPTAVSAFVAPPLHAMPSPSPSAERSSGASLEDATKTTVVAVSPDFYTGPARRSRLLIQR
ncbi:hypothetical protein, unknown function [Leishmania tarentolae]|uniref:Uncharacterized protein n=1 Tax=Leishmania tarentolae TaxID=5689 RepID=A0A640KJ65_LEITA|nr:hypothetical protein, unknown function [Leishmania tarentolae]